MHASGVQGCVGWAAVVIHTQASGLRGVWLGVWGICDVNMIIRILTIDC